MKGFITLGLGWFFNFAVVFSSTYFCFRQVQTNECTVLGGFYVMHTEPFGARFELGGKWRCRGDRDGWGWGRRRWWGWGRQSWWEVKGDGDGEGEEDRVGERWRETELSEERWRYRDKHCPLRHLTTQAKFRLSFADFLSPSVRYCK